MSPLRVRNTRKRLRYSQNFGDFFSAMAENWKTVVFYRLLCVRIGIDQL